MEKDYANLIPEPPDDLVDFVKRRGELKNGWLLYKCGYRQSAETLIKEQCLDVVCTECRTHFTVDRIDVPVKKEQPCHGYAAPPAYARIKGKLGKQIIDYGKKVICPHCRAKLICLHTSKIRQACATSWPLVINRVGNNIVAASYRVMKQSDITGNSEITVDKYEATIIDLDRKCSIRCSAVEKIFYSERFTNTWEQRCRYDDVYGASKLVYSVGNAFKNTVFQNCKLRRYISSVEHPSPIAYLRVFMRRPQIENLLTHQCYNALESIVNGDSDYRKILTLKEKSPRKILGVSKPDFDHVRDLSLLKLKLFKSLRERFPAESATRLVGLSSGFMYRGDVLLKDIDKYGIRFINYICRAVEKKQYKNEYAAYTDWQDYLAAAKNLGYDTKDANTLFPRNLKAAHDNAIKARKYKEDEKLREKFKEQFQKLQPLAWENGDLIIRPAASEQELIVEGKILSHCVGGYGRSHCNDSPIFFIRRAGAPDDPYFTLQLSLANKRVLQNRGKNNCAPPTEVNDFVALWMQEVITKPKTKKRHSTKSDAA